MKCAGVINPSRTSFSGACCLANSEASAKPPMPLAITMKPTRPMIMKTIVWNVFAQTADRTPPEKT